MSMNEFESLFKNNTNQTNKTKDVPITLNSNLQSEFRMECVIIMLITIFVLTYILVFTE